MSFASTSTTSIFNTDTRVRDCGIHKNHFLAPLIAILAFFVTIGFDTMWLMQDKSPVMGQWMRPNLCAKQQVQQSVNNRHVIHDTASQGYALHRISPTITTTTRVLTLLIPYLYGNEPYGRVVHPADEDTSNSNQDDSHLDSTNGPQVAASSSRGSGGDDEEDPFKKKPNNDGCGGDESPTGRNANDQDDDQDHDNENGFIGEVVDVFGSDNPDDFPNGDFDDDMDIDEDVMVEVGVVDKEEDEDMVGLWQE